MLHDFIDFQHDPIRPEFESVSSADIMTGKSEIKPKSVLQ